MLINTQNVNDPVYDALFIRARGKISNIVWSETIRHSVNGYLWVAFWMRLWHVDSFGRNRSDIC